MGRRKSGKSGSKSKDRKKKKQPPKPPFQAKAPTRIEVGYGSAAVLQGAGPLIGAELRVPNAIAEKLGKEGKPIPPPVLGHLLVDTGASSTCIAEDAAQQLGLKPVDVGKTYGAGGLHENNIYQVFIAMHIVDAKHQKTSTISNETRAMGIPKLNNLQGVLHGNGQPVRLIGLLGRDVLKHATFVYRGSKGSIAIEFDMDSFHR
ncbi:MAG: hypothetical protein SangKO_076070 [Sandaracinaceae bacterium]